MLRFRGGHSSAVNPGTAVSECLELAKGSAEDTKLVVVHSTMGHDLKKVLAALHQALPDAEVIGCTGSGVIGESWVSERMRALALLAVSGDEFAVQSVQGITSENSREKAREAATALNEARGDLNMLLAFGPGLNVDGDALVAGMEEVFGPDVPILGGLAGFSGKDQRTPVFHGEQIPDDAFVLVGFADQSLEVIQGAHHGSLAQRDYSFKVTRSDGVRVDELDGRPAWPVLMESLGMPIETSPGDIIAVVGLGTELPEAEQADYDNTHILHAPLYLSEDRQSMFFQAAVPEGTQFVSCQRNEDHIFSGVDRLLSRLRDQLQGRVPVAVLQTDCMARGKMAHNVVEKEGIITQIQTPLLAESGTAWLGVYGFAEFCQLNGRNRFHNYTTSLSILVRKTERPDVSPVYR